MSGTSEKETPRSLPIFRGYTVDERLEQFRKMTLGKRPEFIPFSSKKGEKLLGRMERSERKESEKEWERFIPSEKKGVLGLDVLGRINERIKNIGKR